MTYYLLFKSVRQILKDLHLLLTVGQAHGRVFSDVPIIGFKKAKSLKDHLVRAALPQLDREWISKPCEGAINIPQILQKHSQKKLFTFLKAL